jgi:anti-sigma factor RsiW
MDKESITCEFVNTLLSAYIDGEINSAEKEAIETHLAQCILCQEELDILRQLSIKVKNLFINEKFDIPDLSTAVLDRLQNDTISCENVIAELSAYFDGELEPAQYFAIDDHLSTCSECKTKYHQLENLRKLIKLSVDAVDIDYWNTIYKRLIQPDALECSFIKDQLSAYVDKEVERKLYQAISEHVMLCKNCRKDLKELKNLQDTIKTALLLPAKDIDFWPDVCMRLEKEKREKTFALSAAASVFMVILVWLTLSVIFPLGSIDGKLEAMVIEPGQSQNKSTTISSASGFNTSDAYLFSSVFDEPPSGVIPIMYSDNGISGYGE